MDIEICKNCKCTISPLEQAFVYNGHIVCPDCYQLLRNSPNSSKKKVSEPSSGFVEQAKAVKQSSQISVTEEDFLVAGSEASNITESQTTHGSDKLDSLSTKPVSESNFLGQEPLRITPEDFKPISGQQPLIITSEDFQPVSVQHEPTITIGPEDFKESPVSPEKLTDIQERFQSPKSIRVEESDFISKPITKSAAQKVVKATGMSFKAKMLTFIIVAAAGGGAFVAYEGGLTQAKTEVNYLWTKLSFSAGRASPEEVCKMYLLACWKGDRSTATSLLTQDTQRVMADAERQQDRWRREQVERLRGRRLSDSEWQDLKTEVAKAEPQMASMFEGTRFDFRFGETDFPDNQKAIVEMQARIEMKGPLFENWRRMIQNLSESGSAGERVSGFMERFLTIFNSKWWDFQFLLVREDGAWEIEDIEMPIGEMMEFMFDSLGEIESEHRSQQAKVQKSLNQTRRSTEPKIIAPKAPSVPKVTQNELELYRKSFMKKLAEDGADNTTQNSVEITGIYIRSHGFTDPEIIRTRNRIVFYTWHGKTKRHNSDECPIGSMEFWNLRAEDKWVPKPTPGTVAQTRDQIIADKHFKYWHKIY